MFKARSVILALAVVTVFASAPALAQDHSFRVFATANWISPLAEDDIDFGAVQDSIQGSTEVGYEAGFEWRMNKLVGLEGSYLVGSNDFEFGNTDIGSLDSSAITAALNFHIIPTKIFDLWVAPCASWYSFDDFELDSGVGGGSVSIGDEWGYGAQVGFDIGLGKTFAITGGVRYVKLSVNSDDAALNDDVGIDPLISRVGIAIRFGNR
ncbi:MAG TPA: OmpW family outer membrane protein [Verrucomicrobiae bacterium]|nr:OmpW family outer membrane protein [Verrucomicrobiae bacterium]